MSEPHSPVPHSADTAVAFPDSGTDPFPVPRPAGSAVSAASALRPALEQAERGTLMDTLSMVVLERGAQRSVVRMPVEGARQVAGVLHGGATAALIETAASVAARRAAPQSSAARPSGIADAAGGAPTTPVPGLVPAPIPVPSHQIPRNPQRKQPHA